MKLRLLDYSGKEFFCEVPDSTEQITIDIISGDMIMTNPVHFDTGKNSRLMDFFDYTVTLNKEDFHILDEITNSYLL